MAKITAYGTDTTVNETIEEDMCIIAFDIYGRLSGLNED